MALSSTTTRPALAPPARTARPAPPVRRASSMAGPGITLCLISAACFGALPVLGKKAYDVGMSPLGLLWGRFTLAALVFWALVVVVVRPPRPSPHLILAGLAMGFSGYAVEATLFFSALHRIDASLTELLLYAYPALVTAVAVVLGREAASRRLAAALALASGGVVLVFAGSLATGVNPLGLALGLGSAAVYAGYVLAGERVVAALHPILLAALVSTGAAAAFTAVAGLAGGGLPLPPTGAAWGVVAVIAVAATVVPMTAFFAGMERAGAATASIVSTLEPVVTVALAAVFLGEQLSAVEALGAASVLAAVRLLQGRTARFEQPAAVPA